MRGPALLFMRIFVGLNISIKKMCRPFGPRCQHLSNPALTRGAIHCRRFAPGFVAINVCRETCGSVRPSRRQHNDSLSESMPDKARRAASE